MKNLPVYLFGILLTVYIMIMYTTPVFFIVFLGLIAVLVFELLTTLYMRQMIGISVEGPGKLVHCKEMIPIIIHIHNRSFLPLNHLRVRIWYQNNMGESRAKQWLCTYADGRCSAAVTFYVESNYCGIIHVHIDKLYIGGYLRIFGFTKKCGFDLDIPVFPELFPVNFEISSKIRDFIGESDTYSKEKSGDDPSEVFDIREFRPGDRMQRIHWKLTARLDEFMVKEFSRPVGYPVVVFFNFSQIKKDETQLCAMSMVIEAGLSVSVGLARAHCWHYIAWCKTDMSIERCAVESEEDVYHFMGRLLYAHPHVPLKNPGELYGREWGFDSFCTFLSINSNMTIEKDGEIYEEKGLDRDTLSGKNFIL